MTETPKEVEQMRSTLMHIVGKCQNFDPKLVLEACEYAAQIRQGFIDKRVNSSKAFIIMSLMLLAALEDIEAHRIWNPVLQ